MNIPKIGKWYIISGKLVKVKMIEYEDGVPIKVVLKHLNNCIDIISAEDWNSAEIPGIKDSYIATHIKELKL